MLRLHSLGEIPCSTPTVLCGKVGGECVITGAVRVNDEHMPLAKLRKIMGFVPQDDTVHVDLTVRCDKSDILILLCILVMLA